MHHESPPRLAIQSALACRPRGMTKVLKPLTGKTPMHHNEARLTPRETPETSAWAMPACIALLVTAGLSGPKPAADWPKAEAIRP
jgi:hypothetical protein